jgi:hypothetical protein
MRWAGEAWAGVETASVGSRASAAPGAVFRSVSGDGAGEARVAVGDPALVARLRLRHLLVALGGGEQGDAADRRGHADPQHDRRDAAGDQRLGLRAQHIATHLFTRTQVKMALRKEFLEPECEAGEAS